jgi:PmbA protein
MSATLDDPRDRLADLLAIARRAGADEADAVFFSGTSLSVSRRLGKIEHVERSEGRDLGLRVFVGERSAIVSAPGLDVASFTDIAARAVAMARVVPADPMSSLGELREIPPADLDLDDPAEPDATALAERAALAEDAVLAVHGITNTEGADAGFSRCEAMLVTSRGFFGSYRRTGHSISATALAGNGTAMQRDYDFSSAVHLSDLDDPAGIGHRAAERALARLDPTRPKTAKISVVYDPRVSASLIGHLAGAVNGSGIVRGTSFLRDRMGERVFAEGIVIRDDPRRRRGLRSRPFDGEGQPTAPLDIIADGVLKTWILDTRSARQLGLTTTGHAAPRHLRAAGAIRHKPLHGAGPSHPGGADGRHHRGAVCDRTHRLRHQRDHRRLQPRRSGVHDPGRRAGGAGGRDHHCGQSQGDVPASHPRQ